MATLYFVLILIVGLRLGELAWSRRNQQRLLARGGYEIGAGHYPLFILLHGGWIVCLAVFAEPVPRYPSLLLFFLMLQPIRLWIIASLGDYWTTRIITVDGSPLVRRGPYRWFRHPNYAVVVIEIAILPLAFGLVWMALVFSVLNGFLLRHRIRIETKVLSARRGALG